jgi:hypothetical protein
MEYTIEKKICEELGVTSALVFCIIKRLIEENKIVTKDIKCAPINSIDIYKKIPFIHYNTVRRCVKKLEDSNYIFYDKIYGNKKWMCYHII